jgi:hypothetical protein
MGELPLVVRIFQRFWLISPFKIAFTAFSCGFVPFALAVQMSSVGDVAYYMAKTPGAVCDAAAIAAKACITKQVGYLHALNWWPTQIILLPFGLFFAFESIQNSKAVLERMLANRMFADPSWTQPTADINPAIRRLWRTFLFVGLPLFLVIAGLFFSDWRCVVYQPIKLGVALGDVIGSKDLEALLPAGVIDQLRASGCLLRNAHENDWSVASSFGSVAGLAPLADGYDKPDRDFAFFFATYNYVMMAFWSAVLVAYFGFIMALAIMFYEINRNAFGFQLVPDLNSSDDRERRGFELIEPILRPCIYVTMLAFMMAFLMRIQNIYLRNREHETIYNLLFADIPATFGKISAFGLLGLWEHIKDVENLLSNLTKMLVDFGQYADPQSLLGAPAILLVLSLVTAVLSHILRGAASGAQSRLLSALHNRDLSERVSDYYRLSPSETERRASHMQNWPLSWPEFGYAVRLMLSGLFCYVFYRVAFIWMGYVAYRSIQGRLSERK